MKSVAKFRCTWNTRWPGGEPVTLRLFDDQTAFRDAIRDRFAVPMPNPTRKRRILGVAPTGFGKTVVYAHIAAGTARKGKRVVILEPRDFLLEQTSDTLKEFNVPHGILVGGQYGTPRNQVVVASVYTLAKRLKHFPPPDLIIPDEAHHCVPGSTYAKCVDAFPQAHVLGVTASPQRLDGTGLGEMFDDMVVGPTTAELIALGRLVPFDVYASATPLDLSGVKRRAGDYAAGELETAMDKPTLVGSAVAHYQRLGAGKLAVAFCVSIKHAENEAAGFRAAGIPAQAVHGKMDRDLIKRYMGAFRRREILVLTAADLISEGFDLPQIEVAILRRPTQSLSLYLQQVGRGLRTARGKERLLILDHAGNTAKHGMPDEDREWSLDGAAQKQDRGETVARVMTCTSCFAMHRPAPVCPRCGHVYEIKGRKIEQVEGDLVRVVGGEVVHDPAAAAQKEQLREFCILRNIGKKQGKPDPEGWAYHVMASKLAQTLAKEREPDGVTTNGLTAGEHEDLRRRTVMRAMEKEGPVAA